MTFNKKTSYNMLEKSFTCENIKATFPLLVFNSFDVPDIVKVVLTWTYHSPEGVSVSHIHPHPPQHKPDYPLGFY